MDLSHELGALRFVVDSPLSSKVAMFNQQVSEHKQGQLLNPFSTPDGRASPKPSFSKDEYGKPLAGSLTEMRGQKANIHVLKEMLELCQIIDSEGYDVKDEPSMRVIPFGELFNIYNYISDKVVGILLRARKHKLVEFEGEMLFQRRDDDVPIFLLKPIHEIRRELEGKIDGIKRCGSPAPQATSVLLDKKAHGLNVPRGATPRNSVSRTPSPQSSKAGTPQREVKPKGRAATPPLPPSEKPKIQISAGEIENLENNNNNNKNNTESNKTSNGELPAQMEIKEINDNKGTEVKEVIEVKEVPAVKEVPEVKEVPDAKEMPEVKEVPKVPEVKEIPNAPEVKAVQEVVGQQPLEENKVETKANEINSEVPATPVPEALNIEPQTEIKPDVNNNNNTNINELPTIIVEASAVFEHPANTVETAENKNIPNPESNSASAPASDAHETVAASA